MHSRELPPMLAMLQVNVVAPPRQLPSVKDTAWPSERSKWQALVPPEASEGLLCDAEGCVLEGFVTNFFAVGALLIRTCAAGGRVCVYKNPTVRTQASALLRTLLQHATCRTMSDEGPCTMLWSARMFSVTPS